LETTPPDHYATLGLDRRCTLAQIRSAWRLLAKRHHPDVNGGSEEAAERLKQINGAHDVLSDPARRRAYDYELSETEQAPPPPRVSRLERNLTQDARLRIEDFLRGATLQVRVNDPGNPNGAEVYELVVPPDTAPGTRFKLPRTAPFEGGFVNVRVKAMPSSRFQARGSDLRTELRISAQRAAQGGSEMVASAGGRQLRVEIPAGVMRGEVVRIPREGLPKPRGGRGDLLVKITYRPEVRITRR
jgi:DnaJ-class molecular chaperone